MAHLGGVGMICHINHTGDFHPFTRSRIIVSYHEVLFRHTCLLQSIEVIAKGKGYGRSKSGEARFKIISQSDDVSCSRRCRRAGIDTYRKGS